MRFTLSLSPVAIRLTGLAGLVFALSLAGTGEAVAGPTVKKRTWYTLQGRPSSRGWPAGRRRPVGM
jgi:hypothetical protein